MKQKFVLENEDMEILKNNGTIELAFAGGKIQLSAELVGGHSRQPKDAQLHREQKLAVANYLKLVGKPILVMDLSEKLGLSKQKISGILYGMKMRKEVVNSDIGWRPVTEIQQVKPKSLVSSHKGSSNGR